MIKERMLRYTDYKYYFLLILIFLSLSIYSQNTHVGLWKGIDDKGKIGFMNLDSNGYAFFVLNNDTLGGKDFTVNGVSAKFTYTIDYNTNPKTIDLIITRLDTNKELGRLLGIIEFIVNTKMKIRLGLENPERPKDFMPEGNTDTIILDKINE